MGVRLGAPNNSIFFNRETKKRNESLLALLQKFVLYRSTFTS